MHTLSTGDAPQLLRELGSIRIFRDATFGNFYVIDLPTRHFEVFEKVIEALRDAQHLQGKK
jgi:hypothetical protein